MSYASELDITRRNGFLCCPCPHAPTNGTKTLAGEAYYACVGIHSKLRYQWTLSFNAGLSELRLFYFRAVLMVTTASAEKPKVRGESCYRMRDHLMILTA
jgi:hypothetical protein